MSRLLAFRLASTALVVGCLSSACGTATSSDDEAGGDGEAGAGGNLGGTAGSPASGGTAGSSTGGRGGSSGTAGAPVVDCEGFDVSQSGVLDLDLHAISVSGRVTLAGAPLPDEANSRGALVFRSSDGLSEARVELESSGPRTYSLRLPPGTYDVSFSANPALCAWPSMPNVPCGSGRLRSAVALTSDGVLDVDIPVVSVSGNVTLNGGAFPEVGKRGSIVFASADDGGGAVALPASGAAAYRLNLLPGTYDVSFAGDPSECTGEVPPAVPCNSGRLRASVALTSSGVLDLDVRAIRVTGVVTLNGALPPSEDSPRGTLAFSGEAGDTVLTKPLPRDGMPSYELMLVPGRYAVDYVPSADLCAGEELPSMPCAGGTVLPAQELSSSGALDVDVRAVTVIGQVTLNGALLPTEAADRGTLSFANAVGGVGVTRGLQATGVGQYSMRVLAGSYDIAYVPNAALCASETPPNVPCTGGTVSRGVMMQADGAYDVDLERVHVSGIVTLNGGAMPAAEGERGVVRFSLGESSVEKALGPSGTAQYAFSLWTGTYRVDFDANASLCENSMTAPPIPCIGGTLIPNAALAMDGVLDLDVRAVSLTGNFTLNQTPLPTATVSRGTLEIARPAGDGSDGASHALGTDAAPSYAVTLVPGRYVFLHAAIAALCSTTEPPPTVPCVSQALAGCD